MIPVNEPALGEAELANVQRALTSGWISSAGEFVERFERDWAAYCGRKHGISVANGTLALELAVAVLKLPAGSEILMPSFTIISCAIAAVANDCVPALVDVDPETLCLDPAQLAAAVTPRTRAIMPVHINGHPVDMDPVLAFARERGLHVIEDAAEAHGATYRGRRCGSFGDLSAFSFYANKIVTTGEGGMVLTDDDELAARARSRRNLCFGPPRRFVHQELGRNFRFTNLQAAVGVAQIARVDELLARRRHLAEYYDRALAGTPGLQLPVQRAWATNVYWMYGIVLADEVPFDAEHLIRELAARGVETRPYFMGLHEQPALRDRGLYAGLRLPVTERIARRGVHLPSGATLTDGQLEHVAASVKAVLAGA